MSIASHPTRLLDEMTERFRRERTLIAFLDCVDQAAVQGVGASLLPGLWRDLGESVIGAADLGSVVETFGLWLAKHKFVPEDEIRWAACPNVADEDYVAWRKEIDNKSKPDSQSIYQEAASAVVSEVKHFLDSIEEDVEHVSDETNPYAAFRPALEIQEFLEEHFSSNRADDPGAIIGKYLRLLFPATTPAEPEIHWYEQEELMLIRHSWIHDLVSNICRSLCESLLVAAQPDDLRLTDAAYGFEIMSEELSALAEYRHPQVIDRETAIQKLSAICCSPQALLSALCRIQNWANYEPQSGVLIQVLSSMPWGQEKSTPTTCWKGIHHVFGDRPDNTSRSCIPWAVATELDEVTRLLGNDEDVLEGLKRLLGTWLSEIHRNHKGRSPLSAHDIPVSGVLERCIFSPTEMALDFSLSQIRSGTLGELEWETLAREFRNDLWFLLGLAHKMHFSFLSLAPYAHSEQTARADEQVFLKYRPCLFLRLVDAAQEAGFTELANALLAFGVYAQALMGYASAGWSRRRLDAILLQSRDAPGANIVRKAISIAASVRPRSDYALHQVWLSSYVIGSSAHSIQPRPLGQSRREIERNCREQISEECWIWLCPETKNQLIDAELIYSRCHMDIGVGGFINFGGLAVNYCKALEAELMFLFQDVFKSKDFADYRKIKKLSGKPTFGNAVYLIENFHAIPRALQIQMEESHLAALDESGLVEWLLFFKDARNDSAHPGDFSGPDFLKIRERSMRIYPRLMATLGRT